MNSPHQPLTEITDDASLIQMWLVGKGLETKKLYTRTVRQFLEFVGRELADVHLEDLLQWMESLSFRRYSKNTISLKVSVVKSLFSYATKIGYLNFNVTAALKAPSQVNALHERFLVSHPKESV